MLRKVYGSFTLANHHSLFVANHWQIMIWLVRSLCTNNNKPIKSLFAANLGSLFASVNGPLDESKLLGRDYLKRPRDVEKLLTNSIAFTALIAAGSLHGRLELPEGFFTLNRIVPARFGHARQPQHDDVVGLGRRAFSKPPPHGALLRNALIFAMYFLQIPLKSFLVFSFLPLPPDPGQRLVKSCEPVVKLTLAKTAALALAPSHHRTTGWSELRSSLFG